MLMLMRILIIAVDVQVKFEVECEITIDVLINYNKNSSNINLSVHRRGESSTYAVLLKPVHPINAQVATPTINILIYLHPTHTPLQKLRSTHKKSN